MEKITKIILVSILVIGSIVVYYIYSKDTTQSQDKKLKLIGISTEERSFIKKDELSQIQAYNNESSIEKALSKGTGKKYIAVAGVYTFNFDNLTKNYTPYDGTDIIKFCEETQNYKCDNVSAFDGNKYLMGCAEMGDGKDKCGTDKDRRNWYIYEVLS